VLNCFTLGYFSVDWLQLQFPPVGITQRSLRVSQNICSV
jgi:hypothetical protein